MNENELESEIEEKGLTAPRITPKDVDAAIAAIDFHVFPGTTLTVCALTLNNGFMVTGESAAASPRNFDADIGRDLAFSSARNKIWSFLGFRLRDQLASAEGAPGVS